MVSLDDFFIALRPGGFQGVVLVLLLVDDNRMIEGIILDPMELGSMFRNLADNEPLLVRALPSGKY